MKIILDGAQPYDGGYELGVLEEFSSREWGWIKRLTGYLPLTLEEGLTGGDPEIVCALAVIALHRAHRVEQADVPAVYERLVDLPFGSTITIEIEDQPAEDDAGPPALSSNGSDNTSGDGSRTSSERSAVTPVGSGTPGLGSSVFDPPTSAR